jgi:hypothetical protein
VARRRLSAEFFAGFAPLTMKLAPGSVWNTGVAGRMKTLHLDRRVGRDPAILTRPAQFGVIQAVAPSLRVEVNPVNVHDARLVHGRGSRFGE